jgi:superfamily I DNA/RNA helicase
MQPHLMVLGMVKDAPFAMGRQLLADCLAGEDCERIRKLKLNKCVYYSSLPLYQHEDIFELIDLMLRKGLLKYSTINKYMKVLEITPMGLEELNDPKLDLKINHSFEGHYSCIEQVTDADKEVFGKLGEVLADLSDEQKKAVIFDSPRILCVAGAGSGKTKVLTKRAYFLNVLKSVPQSRILCITFTRKARQEMLKRLDMMLPSNNIQVETFNSFCESILRKKESVIYDKKYSVLDYRTRVKIIVSVIKELHIDPDSLLDKYYTSRQLHSKDRRTLFLGFVNDIYSLVDYQANHKVEDDELKKYITLNNDSFISGTVWQMLQKIKHYKKEQGLRDYTDQLIHVIEYFKANKDDIPKFDHILVDEYQDINNLQNELLSLLNPPNLFAVGDPRQAIFGWRGAIIDYILDFQALFPDAKILQLTKNYRSVHDIVDLGNKVVKTMKLPDLTHERESKAKCINIIRHNDDNAEALFVSNSIASLNCKRNEIFVLARTNRQIENLSGFLDKSGIKYLKRTVEEQHTSMLPADDEITISTIHAIKGLEADTVYIIGANTKNHPCKASEHPLLESIKINDNYDKFDEELRLFYVALTRARDRLVINYSGSLTSYLDTGETIKPKEVKVASGDRLYSELRSWRYEESAKLNIPAYQVFNDSTLQEICDIKPMSKDELFEITGFGPYKVRRWGKMIVEIVRREG